MSFWSLVLIALGLSADAFAVALGKGMNMRRLNYRHAFFIALAFGLFQALMPVAGWLLGSGLSSYISAYDHWVAFVLLAGVGGKMLWEAFSDEEDEGERSDALDVKQLFVLAIATSIDALAVGVTFAFLPDVPIFGAVVLIGVLTFAISFLGVFLGHRAGQRLGKPAEIAGGVVLIVIGAHLLGDHLGFW